MVYDGFQLLTCDYEDIREPSKILPRTIALGNAVATLALVIWVAKKNCISKSRKRRKKYF